MNILTALDNNLAALQLYTVIPDEDPDVRLLPFEKGRWIAIKVLETNELRIFSSPLASVNDFPGSDRSAARLIV